MFYAINVIFSVTSVKGAICIVGLKLKTYFCFFVSSSCARLRICMLINWLLKNLGDTFEIEDALYDKIFTNMIERLRDKVAEIRAQAVTALFRLQNPRDPDCPVIKAFLFHLGCDPSALVRRTIIKNIGSSKIVLGFIIKRISDTDETVRVAAYKFLAEKVIISKYFSERTILNTLNEKL